MPDITAITAGLQSLKIAVDIVQDLRQMTKTVKNAEISLKFADLTQTLAEAKLKLVDVQEENITLRERITKLEDEIEVQKNLIWEPPYYWVNKEDKKEGPFCQHCYDNDKKLIHLQSPSKGKFFCCVCKNGFIDGDYEPPKRRPHNVARSNWLA
jgi:hypothetical protein